MMKSERDEIALQQQVFDRITSTARAEDDFSIHMIEEASLQRLQALSTQFNQNNEKGIEKSFPLSGGLQAAASSNGKQNNSPVLNMPILSTESKLKRNTSSLTYRHSRLKKRIDGKAVEDQKRHKRNRKMISEVRKRVQEAHQTQMTNQQERIPLKSANHNVPHAYKGRKLVYTRQGQVPQFRNGELDWNYLWFFSDSSSATNSTNSSSVNQNQSESSSLNQTTLSVSSDSSAQTEAAIAPPPTQVSQTPPHKSVKSASPTVSIMRQATKKRIRRLAANPPQDDNLTLLGMV